MLFPRFAAVLTLGLIEPSPSLRREQERRLGDHASRMQWLEPVAGPWTALGAGCVFANEVLDALPVHRVLMTERGLRETYVDIHGTGFRACEGPLSSSAIAEQIAAGGGQLAPGQHGEVNLSASRLVRSLASLVDPGYLLLLDYGEPATNLYGLQHPDGTLRCYWRHTLNRDPLRRVGVQDITADVDLTAVTHAAEEAGLELIGATRQTRLLQRLGAEALSDAITGAALRRVEERAHLAALSLLLDPRELGRLAVLGFGRNAPRRLLSGFSDHPVEPPEIPSELMQLRSAPAEIARTVRSGRGRRR
jgi:SAM-dependent MidA family methyltransferase